MLEQTGVQTTQPNGLIASSCMTQSEVTSSSLWIPVRSFEVFQSEFRKQAKGQVVSHAHTQLEFGELQLGQGEASGLGDMKRIKV